MAVPTVLYDSECWMPRQKELRALQTTETKFLRAVQKCSMLDGVSNDDILTTLDIEELVTTAYGYKMNWRDHVLHMPPDRIPRTIVEYAPQRKGNVGRSRLKWSSSEQAEVPKPGQTDDNDYLIRLT